MGLNVAKEVAALERMAVQALREKYAAVFGEATVTKNRAWLVKRIAWRLQVIAEGDLSERAKARAAELARDADLRVIPPREKVEVESPRVVTAPIAHDRRLPPPGTILTRTYKKGAVQVKVLADGFEFRGERFASLSAVAKAVTGSHCNGFHFFRLSGKAGAA